MKYFLLNIIILFFSCSIYAQDTINATYFKNLIAIFSKMPEVKDFKFVQKKYLNGHVKGQAMFVKISSDTIKNRYWLIGKEFYYYKNGILRGIQTIDINSRIDTDTAYAYDKNGIIEEKLIYNKLSKKAVPVKAVFSFKSLFEHYYENYTDEYEKIVFKKGKIKSRVNFKYFENSWFVEHGEMNYYKEDGTVEKVEKYEKGVLIK